MGNSFYSSKEYAKAIEAYTSGLQVDDSNVALLTNRAAAFLMTHQFKDVVSDCDKAIHIEPSNARAYFRKATALKGRIFFFCWSDCNLVHSLGKYQWRRGGAHNRPAT